MGLTKEYLLHGLLRVLSVRHRQVPLPGIQCVVNMVLLFSRVPQASESPICLAFPHADLKVTTSDLLSTSSEARPESGDPGWPGFCQGAGSSHLQLPHQPLWLLPVFLPQPGRGWVLIHISQTLRCGFPPGTGPWGPGVGWEQEQSSPALETEDQRAWGSGGVVAQMPERGAGSILELNPLPMFWEVQGLLRGERRV